MTHVRCIHVVEVAVYLYACFIRHGLITNFKGPDIPRLLCKKALLLLLYGKQTEPAWWGAQGGRREGREGREGVQTTF